MTTVSRNGAGTVGVEPTWTRERVIEFIHRWVALFGAPPTAADLNPSSAKFSRQEWRVERYLRGDPDTGEPWPSLNAVKRRFLNGAGNPSLNEAIKAAGYEPTKSGPRRHAEVDATHVVGMDPAVKAVVAKLEAEVKKLEKTVATRDRQLDKSRRATDNARAQTDDARRAAVRARRAVGSAKPKTTTKTKTKTVTKTRVDRKAIREAEAAVRADMKVKVDEARAEATARRQDATKAVGKAERLEARVEELSDERKALRDKNRRLEVKVEASASALAREKAREAPVRTVREVVEVELAAPEQAVVDEAREKSASIDRELAEADERVARAERDYKELAVLVTGERRMLTAAEKVELRAKGPAGAPVLAEALAALASARRGGGKTDLYKALTGVTSAAMTWRDRL